MKRDLKNWGKLIPGRDRNLLKKGAGIKCPGKKRLALKYPKHAPRGLKCLSPNEMFGIVVKGDP